MSQLSRRDFLGQSAVAVGALAVAQAATAAETPRKLTSATQQVTVGRTGIQTSLVGMGTGSVGVKRSSNQVRLGQEKFNRLVRHAYDKGITYFDVADQYGSHIYLREALKGLPREKLRHPDQDPRHRLRRRPQPHRSLPRGAGHRLHRHAAAALHDRRRLAGPTFGRSMDVLSRSQGQEVAARRRRLVPRHGAAAGRGQVRLGRGRPGTHQPGRRQGPHGRLSPRRSPLSGGDARRGQGRHRHEDPGRGHLQDARAADASLKFVLGLGSVDAFVIGFESPEQIDQILGHLEKIIKG